MANLFKKWLKYILSLSCGLSIIAYSNANAEQPVFVTKSIVLNVPSNTVWGLLCQFDHLDWHPAIATTELLSGHAKQPGAIRRLTTHDGLQVIERLAGFSEQGMACDYQMEKTPLPVKNFSGNIRVINHDNATSRVVWMASFEPLQTSATAMVEGFLQAGLTALGQQFGEIK